MDRAPPESMVHQRDRLPLTMAETVGMLATVGFALSPAHTGTSAGVIFHGVQERHIWNGTVTVGR